MVPACPRLDGHVSCCRASQGAAAKPWLVELTISATNATGDEFPGPYYAYVIP
ncbi:MAG: hypothetical protein ABIR11_03650 [Candidatus Limnocylindrales bacterium]